MLCARVSVRVNPRWLQGEDQAKPVVSIYQLLIYQWIDLSYVCGPPLSRSYLLSPSPQSYLLCLFFGKNKIFKKKGKMKMLSQ